jgi:hypothetical protein
MEGETIGSDSGSHDPFTVENRWRRSWFSQMRLPTRTSGACRRVRGQGGFKCF